MGGSGVVGGRLLESLLLEPQDVLRKKSAQSCTLTFRAWEVHGREASSVLEGLPRKSGCICNPGCRDLSVLGHLQLPGQPMPWIKFAAMKREWKQKD